MSNLFSECPLVANFGMLFLDFLCKVITATWLGNEPNGQFRHPVGESPLVDHLNTIFLKCPLVAN